MRNNLNKVIAFAIGVSVITGNVVPVIAAETKVTYINEVQNNKSNSKPILTLNDAVNAAINNSDTIKLYDKKITMLNKVKKDNEKLEEVAKDNNKMDSTTQDYLEDSRELELKSVKRDRDRYIDKLTRDITTKYNDLVTCQKKIDKARRDLEVSQKDLDDYELKVSLGLSTELEKDSYEIKIISSKNDIQKQENELKNAQDYFKQLTNKDVSKYSLVEDIEYNKFTIDESVDDYFDEIIESYMEYDEENIKLNKDYLDDNKPEEVVKPSGSVPNKDDYKDENGTVDRDEYEKAISAYNKKWTDYTDYLSKHIDYLKNKYKLAEGQVNIEDAKKNLKNGLKSLYAAALDLENNIDLLGKSMELTNSKIKLSKVQYDLGLITQNQYNKECNSAIEIEINMRNLIDNYNKIIDQIEKPWLISQNS